jgi:hypothetical protein
LLIVIQDRNSSLIAHRSSLFRFVVRHSLLKTTAPPPFVLVKKVTSDEATKISAANGIAGCTFYLEGVQPHKFEQTAASTQSQSTIGSVKFLTPIEYKIIANHRDGGFSHEMTVMLR